MSYFKADNKTIVGVVSTSAFVMIFIFIIFPYYQSTVKSNPIPTSGAESLFAENYAIEISIITRDQSNPSTVTTLNDDGMMMQEVAGHIENAIYLGDGTSGKEYAFDKKATKLYWVVPTSYPDTVNATKSISPEINTYLTNYTISDIDGSNSILFQLDKNAVIKLIRQNPIPEAINSWFAMYFVTYNIPSDERIHFISEIKQMNCKQLDNWNLNHIGENQDYSDLVNTLLIAKCGVLNK